MKVPHTSHPHPCDMALMVLSHLDPMAKIAHCPLEPIPLPTTHPSMCDPQIPLQLSVTCDPLLANRISGLAILRLHPEKEGQSLLLPFLLSHWQGHGPRVVVLSSASSTSEGTEEQHRGRSGSSTLSRGRSPTQTCEKFPFSFRL